MAHFDDLILPLSMSYGSSFGPTIQSQQLITTSGIKKTNRQWSQHLRTFEIGYNVRTPEDLYLIKEIFEAMEGINNSFLMRDWTDWNTTKGKMGGDDAAGDPVTKDDMPLRNTVDDTFVGDASTVAFQLLKSYQPSGSAARHDRDITKPATGGIKLALDAVLQTDPGDYSYSVTTGIVTFVVAPGIGVVPTWGGNYYTPVCFAEQSFLQTVGGFEDNEVSIVLQEVRGV